MATPETKKPTPDAVQGLSVADLIDALRALKGEDEETLRKKALYEAEAHQRLTKRENEQSPGISVFSFPEGDRAAAEAGKFKRLKCDMYWVGYPLETDLLTPTEVDLLNAAEPGEYTFHRTDGTLEKLTVKGERSATGEWHKLEIQFPCRGDYRHNLPSQIAIMQEAFGILSQEQQELRRLREQVASLARSA